MNSHRTAKLFMHGGSQAVRLPKEFRFEGQEVRIRKEGARVILEPTELDREAFWRRIDQLAEEAGEPFPDRYPQPDDEPPASFEE